MTDERGVSLPPTDAIEAAARVLWSQRFRTEGATMCYVPWSGAGDADRTLELDRAREVLAAAGVSLGPPTEVDEAEADELNQLREFVRTRPPWAELMDKTLSERDEALALAQDLAAALDVSRGIRHDLDGHTAKYVDCLIPGCRREREVWARWESRSSLGDTPERGDST